MQQWDTIAMQQMSDSSAIDCSNDPGVTQQAPAEETDINVIIKRFGITDGSQLPYWPDSRAIYGDISGYPDDPTELANMMRSAELNFLRLPADVRERFSSPDRLIKFLDDPKNEKEAIEMGLLKDNTTSVVSSSTSSVKEPTSATTSTNSGA